jgi:16S rRNA (adenine1518-N6/adenine1519-N6)-dimethyltransferase
MFVSPREYFRERKVSPRKRFGQHFLNQPRTAERIVEAGGLCPSDVVIEVGPGLGALTRFIMPRVNELHLVELDRDLATFLEEHLPAASCRLFYYQQDILTFDFCAIANPEKERLVVMGNLPYNISSPLIFRLLEARCCLKRAVLMVQKEVGERLTAGPGGKDYGVLSVLLGTYAKVRPLFAVGAVQFYPPPEVDSLVISIDFIDDPEPTTPSFFFLKKLVNTSFQQRRKTLLNSLKALARGNVTMLQKVLLTSGIDPQRRPETLSSEEFVRLARNLEGIL